MPRNGKKVSPEVLKSGKKTIVVVSGRGDYSLSKLVPKGTFSKLGGAAGGALGTAAGSAAGGPALGVPGGLIGGELGRRAGAALAKIVGFGDYAVRGNSLLGGGFTLPADMGVPQFVEKTASTVIRHREYVCDLVVPATPTAFTNVPYRINPGNVKLFPWLSTIAACFQQYRMHGMIVEFRSSSSDITAGGALGTVIIATNYDVEESDFGSKLEMENSEYGASCKPSMSLLHAIECDPKESADPVKYIYHVVGEAEDARDGSAPDLRLYDVGNLQVATTGLPGTAGQVLGELWVSYEIELYKSRLGTTNHIGQATSTSGVTPTGPCGTAFSFLGGFAIKEFVASTHYLFAVPGDYLVQYTIQGAVPNLVLVMTFPDSTSTMVNQDLYSCSYLVRAETGDRIIPTVSRFTSATSAVLRVAEWPYAWA